MSSLIIHGDLNSNGEPINQKVYLRPILKPRFISPEETDEYIPDNILFVDFLYSAIKRMKEGEEGIEPVAPSVNVVNFSLGDRARPFLDTISPEARLLDYLSYKYKILFIVSAGNQDSTQYINITFDKFKNLDFPKRNKEFVEVKTREKRNLRLLAPAEHLNSLTVGATYDDLCSPEETNWNLLAVDKGFLAPYSAVGNGYRKSISPSLLLPGGRTYIKRNNKYDSITSFKAPTLGCRVAAPSLGLKDEATDIGTSCSAALLSHQAAKSYDILKEIFKNSSSGKLPSDEVAVLLKAILVHGSSRIKLEEEIGKELVARDFDSNFLFGYGTPDFARVRECTQERVTLITVGKLNKDEGHVYSLPIPMSFSSEKIKRTLTVTLSYFSPIAPRNHKYRKAQLWFDVIDEKGLVRHRQNPDWRSVRRGTLQHEIFEGEEPIVWEGKDLEIKVSCREETGKIEQPVPYSLLVTFEIEKGQGLDLYAKISEIVSERIAFPLIPIRTL